MVITLDGPSASGKSTIARLLAQQLGYYYLSSGLLYRGVAYVLMHDYGYTFEKLYYPVQEVLQSFLESNVFEYCYNGYKESLLYNNNDITVFLKTAAIDKASSIVATNTFVRTLVTDLQRCIALNNNIVAEGRDAGSVVFPLAEYHFFITAQLLVRAKRWLQLQEKQYSLEEAQRILAERDERDTTRACDPLIIPDDAEVIDTSFLSIAETVNAIRNKIVL